MDSAQIEPRLRDYFSAPGDATSALAAVYLFGSFARQSAGASSDLDVGLLFASTAAGGPGGPAFRIEDELEHLLGRPVQAVVLNDAPVDLVHRVLRDGKLLQEADRSYRIRFEVAARNEYFDLLPTLRRYRRSVSSALIDPDLVEKKLAEIVTSVHQLRTLVTPAKLRSDVKEERFVAATLMIAIQLALDVASHIVSDEHLGEPRTNRELFTLLERAGWVESGLADRLRDMAGFRNVLVHGYSDLDLTVLERILSERLEDLLSFNAMIRRRLQAD